MRLVGFSGYARSGKDTAAAELAYDGWQRIAFADKLRAVLYALNPIVIGDYADSAQFLQKVINKTGWDGYKETEYGPEIRRLLQRLGTEAGRQTLWDSIWVDAAYAGLSDDGKYCITDCRFPNEAKSVVDRGGVMIRITRPGVGPANSHASETSLDDWPFDHVIVNDGSVYDLRAKLLEVL